MNKGIQAKRNTHGPRNCNFSASRRLNLSETSVGKEEAKTLVIFLHAAAKNPC